MRRLARENDMQELNKTKKELGELRSSARDLSRHAGQEELSASVMKYADQLDDLLDGVQQVGIGVLLRLKALLNEELEEDQNEKAANSE